MNIQDVIQDVAEILSWNDGEEITPDIQRKIVRGLKRVFDRFSIDGRKIPTVCQVEHKIKRCETRLGVGKNKEFSLWGSPQTIYYAAWRHGKPDNGCCDERGYSFAGVCDEPIKVICNDADFHHNFPCKDTEVGRPTQLYYQRGEIIFNSRPQVGDTLILRARMPFDVQFSECQENCKTPDQWEFDICPSHVFDHATRESILCEAKDKFDGCEDWRLNTFAKTCGDDCTPPVKVVVTARRVGDDCDAQITQSDDLPDGYGYALTHILAYELRKEAKISDPQRLSELRSDRNDAVKLLHRSNNDPFPRERDYTTPWSARQHCDDDCDYNDGAVNQIGGKC